ncbi:Protein STRICTOSIDINE SYNTHASE-LIKE 10 [Camellia lanceoleosa]|uniref:Protein STRICTOSIDINE SYNTHASE-LIKE 10 n=1 Tax=Camellia lanceoleosa TaxID=1840588 RepID=A0ACC0FU94_9ERIC|nr:Protein STRICTOSIDINE SYNTHASE-LIKE 10 [Camellia lanceoleosa]
MNTRLILTATTLAVVAIFIAFNTSTNHHVSFFFTPTPIPGSNNHLHTAEIIHLTGAVGPESLAFSPAGEGPYTGVADGRILKWQGDDLGWVDFAFTTSPRNECVQPFAPEMEHVCGRPLGLRFDKKTGDLYIADAYFGLQVVGPNGGLATQLVAEVEGQPLRFTNDMDIDEHQDVIYFTDTSTSFHRRQFMSSILSGDKTGRLMKYDKSSKEVTILLRGLAFANGVALSKDHSFVLVAETTTCKILRLWLHGPNAGNSDVFAELPGFPDNVRRNSKGEFWVALHSKKGLLADWVVSNTWVGKALLKLPLSFKQLHYLLVGGKPHATAIKLSEKGEILEVLEDSEGKSLRFISEVEEKNGKLWIGSVMMPFIGIYNQ